MLLGQGDAAFAHPGLDHHPQSPREVGIVPGHHQHGRRRGQVLVGPRAIGVRIFGSLLAVDIGAVEQQHQRIAEAGEDMRATALGRDEQMGLGQHRELHLVVVATGVATILLEVERVRVAADDVEIGIVEPAVVIRCIAAVVHRLGAAVDDLEPVLRPVEQPLERVQGDEVDRPDAPLDHELVLDVQDRPIEAAARCRILAAIVGIDMPAAAHRMIGAVARPMALVDRQPVPALRLLLVLAVVEEEIIGPHSRIGDDPAAVQMPFGMEPCHERNEGGDLRAILPDVFERSMVAQPLEAGGEKVEIGLRGVAHVIPDG